MTDVLSIISIALNVAGAVLLAQYLRDKADAFWAYAALAIGDALCMVVNILLRDWAWALAMAGFTVVMAWLCQFYWRRRKRRGRLAAIGHKARARITAMTQRMRERPARPVLRQVPAGAR